MKPPNASASRILELFESNAVTNPPAIAARRLSARVTKSNVVLRDVFCDVLGTKFGDTRESIPKLSTTSMTAVTYPIATARILHCMAEDAFRTAKGDRDIPARVALSMPYGRYATCRRYPMSPRMATIRLYRSSM